MLKKRKTVQTGLTVLLASGMLLAGCGANDAGNANSAGSANAGDASNADSAQTNDGASSETTSNASNLDPYELTMVFLGNDQKDMPEVQEALNKILTEKINATIKLVPIPASQWGQQTNLMLTSGEKVDLIPSSTLFNFPSLASSGVYLPLDDLLAKYGSGIQAVMQPAQIAAANIKGKTYAIPDNKDMATFYGIDMRKDLVDKYHIDVTKIKSFQDLDGVFQTIKTNEPDVMPLVGKNPGYSPFFQGYAPYDPLGGSIGVLQNEGSELKVVDWYETQEYADDLDWMHKWFQAGYLPKDAATNKQSALELVKGGKAFGFFANMNPAFDSDIARVIGREMISVPLTPDFSTSDMMNNSMWSIPKSSGNPDRAMMMLNLLYSDKELYNLLVWGIEGKHYVKKSDNVIDYPAGVDASNSGYNLNTAYMFGNMFQSYTWTTQDPDIWKKMDEFNKNAVPSKARGFIFDVTNVKTEIAAVSNVVNEFTMGLETGTLDPKVVLPKFIDKLKAAGSDKIVAEKQKQLDEWAKTQQ
ncbi:putative aldouronate transport system substrate-binding protein [Paenibacillus sp. UNC496MF]|uniref:ABC transporter substrate-binding protein n=1 Tax=Paenibacillus sp. UNC496MF TaxID=1502753 RepID=UPI0008ECDE52|nr:ABC transporter substrate-binding protein [Paenibacillus sp. UNC496MF]SFJ58508.1 putative aldouronate transport system substrate-binding protein [Paenibacillus sp. UNC496MF]